eukprot:scaffold10330_cov127-Skeletonema_menzelii.AAC.3
MRGVGQQPFYLVNQTALTEMCIVHLLQSRRAVKARLSPTYHTPTHQIEPISVLCYVLSDLRLDSTRPPQNSEA